MHTAEQLRALISAAEEEHMTDCLMAEFCSEDYTRALAVQAQSRAKLQGYRKQLIALEQQAEVSRA